MKRVSNKVMVKAMNSVFGKDVFVYCKSCKSIVSISKDGKCSCKGVK